MAPHRLLAFVVPVLVSAASPATPISKPPDAYTLTQRNVLGAAPLTATYYRDGNRVVVDTVWSKAVTAHAHLPHGAHIRAFYDLEKNAGWSWDATDASVPCVSGFGDWGDPFQWMTQIFGDDLAPLHPRELGRETIAGLNAKVIELTIPEQGKTKIWLDDKWNLLLKMAASGKDGVGLEVTKFGVGKPPASVFALPASCRKK